MYRAFSSAGLEHLPYKQRVGGSNPSTPTGVFPRGPSGLRGFFFAPNRRVSKGVQLSQLHQYF